ncbi:hypothetical protein CSUI_005749, partial [Cystoisospora suis]
KKKIHLLRSRRRGPTQRCRAVADIVICCKEKKKEREEKEEEKKSKGLLKTDVDDTKKERYKERYMKR